MESISLWAITVLKCFRLRKAILSLIMNRQKRFLKMDTFPDMVKHMLTALLAVGSSSILTGGYQARYSPEPSCMI